MVVLLSLTKSGFTGVNGAIVYLILKQGITLSYSLKIRLVFYLPTVLSTTFSTLHLINITHPPRRKIKFCTGVKFKEKNLKNTLSNNSRFKNGVLRRSCIINRTYVFRYFVSSSQFCYSRSFESPNYRHLTSCKVSVVTTEQTF